MASKRLHPLRYIEHGGQWVGDKASDAVKYVHDYDPFRKPPPKIMTPTSPKQKRKR